MKRIVLVLLPVVLGACNPGSDSAPDPFAPLVVNLGLAGERVYGTGELRLVSASEAGEGRDLDGDGDQLDRVMHVFDVRFGVLTNTGLALDPSVVRDGVVGDVVPPPGIDCSEALAVFPVSELATGRDANGNGIPDEHLTWVFNARTGVLRDLPFLHHVVALGGELLALATLGGEIRVLDARDDSLTELGQGWLLLARDEYVAFLVPEAGSDLNFDGDTTDPQVLQVYDARTRTVANTGWAVTSGGFSPGEVRWADGFFGFHVDEREQGDPELDGELGFGFAFVALDPSTGGVNAPGIVSYGFAGAPQESPRFDLLQVEAVQGDRNDDGDADDLVPLFFDARRSILLQPRLASGFAPVESPGSIGLVDEGGLLNVLDGHTGQLLNLGVEGRWLAGFYESLLATRPENGVDLNGDGDGDDRVLFDWNSRVPAGRNGRLVVATFDGAFGEQALVTVLESFQGADANGDGDLEDAVLTIYNLSDASARTLGLGVESDPDPLSFLGLTAVLVSEAAQGADLNGDGDRLDQVLHRIHVFQRID